MLQRRYPEFLDANCIGNTIINILTIPIDGLTQESFWHKQNITVGTTQLLDQSFGLLIQLQRLTMVLKYIPRVITKLGTTVSHGNQET